MSKRSYSLEYHFHPVGQGLFASGEIHREQAKEPCFQWVYDCGSSSSKNLIDAGIEQLEALSGSRRRLDLVTLSHFDHDHTNGICRLIPKFKIDTLLLPYMPLWQRLIIAFEEGLSFRDRLIRFFINPAAYLTGLRRADIDHIVFVLPGGDEEPPPPRAPSPDPVAHLDDDADNWVFDPELDTFSDTNELNFLQTAAKRTSVGFLRSGSAVRVRGLWEFVPYNDETKHEIEETFPSKVAKERERLLDGGSLKKRNSALRRLKNHYDEQFGHSSEDRNVISLFLYGGPIYGNWKATEIQTVERRSSWRFPPYELWVADFKRQSERFRCSVLYSGDGYLDTPDRLARLIRFLSQERVERTGVFQVMHHGAETNWFKGVAAKISPLFSVFSSDPERKKWGHPHAPVLRDFWGYGAVQVDKHFGVTVSGSMVSQ